MTDDSNAQAAAEASADAARAAELEAEVAKLKDQALRALADAENARRRARLDVEEAHKFAVSALARDLLPVADNLRRALDHIPADARSADPRLDQLAAGAELTERELLAALGRHGIQKVDAAGQPFDPNLHQAIMQVEAADRPPNTVMQVIESGYTIAGRLLRPAMVVVSKPPTAAPAAEAAGGRVDTTA